VAATWRLSRAKGSTPTIRITPLEKLRRADAIAVEAEGNRLLTLHAPAGGEVVLGATGEA
jgi:hypothetical protein